jgi:hypothetical protein
MNWTHGVVLVLAVAVGYWLHSKYPGLLGKVTMGAVSA